MRSLSAVAAFIALASACAASRTDYTGFWKGNCSDGYGVQIKPSNGKLYSVSFCGPGGCSEPGTWKPNTTIVGDPRYEIVSPTQLRIKHDAGDGYFTYNKCTTDPTWIVASREPAQSTPRLDCSLRTSSKEKGVLIAWITDVRETTAFGAGTDNETTVVEGFRPVTLLRNSALEETEGLVIHEGQQFWRALAPASAPSRLRSAASFLDHMNVDHCVAYGTLADNLPQFTLLTSRPLPGVFRAPSKQDRKTFGELTPTCVDQGDYPDGKAPPCTRPTLLALTDLDGNGKSEYWATEPYKWDTGLTVWENTGALVPILQVCVGCSD